MKIISQENKSTFIILEGIAFTIILNLFSPFVQMFAKRIGAQDIHIALINSLPQLIAILVLIPCSILLERLQNKKAVVCLLIFINSLFYIVIAFVPYIPHSVRVIAFVLLIGLMNWPGSLYLTVWQSFFSDNFTGADAGFVYSQRSKYGTLFGLVTVLITGFVLSAASGSEEQRIFTYQIFYLICFVMSMLQILFLAAVKQTPHQESSGTQRLIRLDSIRSALKNKAFLTYTFCAFMFNITWQMGWPVFFLYNVDCVNMDELQLALINVASGFTSFLSYSMWNKLVAKKGSKLIIIYGAIGLAVNPFFFTVPLPFWVIILINIVVGVMTAGYTFTQFYSLLELLPEDSKTIYISIFNTFMYVAGFIAPLIGIWINNKAGVYTTLFITAICRIFAVLLFIARWYSDKQRSGLQTSGDMQA